MQSYKVAVIGAGDRGRAYSSALKSLNEAELVAVCDVLEEKAKKAVEDFGFSKAYSGYKEAISESKPDIVIICTPAYFHSDMGIFALEHDAHVICEKPMDLSLEKSMEMEKVAKLKGMQVALGFQYRNMGNFRRIKHAFEKRLLGEKVLMCFNDIRETRPKIAMHDAQFGNGGPMVDMSCHFFDLMRWFYNSEPKRVYAVCDTYAKGRKMLDSIEHKAPDTATITVEFESGDKGSVMVSWGMPFKVNGHQDMFAVGVDGMLKRFNPFSEEKPVFLLENGDELILGVNTQDDVEDKNRELAVIQGLIRAIEKKGEVQCSPRDGISALATSLAAIRSAKTGRPVEVKDILAKKQKVLDCLNDKEEW